MALFFLLCHPFPLCLRGGFVQKRSTDEFSCYFLACLFCDAEFTAEVRECEYLERISERRFAYYFLWGFMESWIAAGTLISPRHWRGSNVSHVFWQIQIDWFQKKQNCVVGVSSILWSSIKTPSSARSQVSVKLETEKVQLYEVKDFSLHTIVMHTLTKAYRFSRFMGSSTPKTWNEIKFHLNFVSPGS